MNLCLRRRTRFSSLFLVALAVAPLLAGPVSGQSGAASVDSASASSADSLAPGGSAPDTAILAAGPVRFDSVEVLGDSAATRLDSVAIASMSDTTSVDVALGSGIEVDFFGRRPFRVWGSFGGYTVEQRATLLGKRLESFAQNRDASVDSLHVIDGQSVTTIQVGALILMSVTDEDAIGLGIDRAGAALRFSELIRAETKRYRDQLSFRGLVRGGLIAVALLGLMMLLLRGLGWLFGWAERQTASLRASLLRPLKIGTAEVVSIDQVSRIGRSVTNLTRISASLIIVYLFLTAIFGLFPWTQDWSEQLLAYALAPLQRVGELIITGAPNMLAIIIIIAVMRWVMRMSDFAFQQIEAGELELKNFHAELAEPTRKIAKFMLLILSVMLIYPYTPIVDSPVFQGLTVFLGILFSLGSSTAIANMVAGVVLTYTMAFRIGDRVRIGDTFGDVVGKTFLVTRIRTPKNEDVAVPNANVLSNHIINYTAMSREGDGVILHTEVTIGYDVPWPLVHRLMMQAAIDTTGVEPEPPPFVLQKALGDYSVAYELNAYTHDVQRMSALYSGLHLNIQERFSEAEVEIMSPTYLARREGPLTVPDGAGMRQAAAALKAWYAARSDKTGGAES